MMSVQQIEEHKKLIEGLAKLLSQTPMSALELAKATGCGKPTAYRRLAALKEHGFEVRVRRVAGKSGPKAKVYEVKMPEPAPEAATAPDATPEVSQ
jgi:DNA-binding IclR family transcriptional regulator